MPGIHIELKGAEQLRAKLQGLPRAAQNAFDAALLKEAQQIMADAQRSVPVRTGRLRSSARVTAERRGLKMAIFMMYEAPYAIYVHAKTRWADGRVYKPSRWLAKSAERHSRGMAGRLVRAVRDALKGTVFSR